MKIKYFKNPNLIPKFAKEVCIAHVFTKGEYVVVLYYEVTPND